MTAQEDLFGPAPSRTPEGFRHQADLVSEDEEAALVGRLSRLEFRPFEFHGYLGNRRTVSFGLRYDYDRRGVTDAGPPPDFLLPLRERAARFAGLPAEAFAHVLATEYAPGAGIGWHRDKPQFAQVVGVSLLAPCVLRFRRKAGERWDRLSALLAPRSAYLLSGPARQAWQHSIAPMDQLRYSITFRTLA